MKQFIACMCDNDLSHLDVHGNASAEQKAEAWANLFYEYCDIVEEKETRYRARLIGEITLNKRRNELVQGWTNILEQCYSETLANCIRTVGFDVDLNPNDIEAYKHDIERLHAEVASSRLDVRVKEAELSAILDSQSTHESVERKYFEQIFQAINNYRKWNVVDEQSTVLKYCVALRSYADDLEDQKTKRA